ncbi:MAG TPA: hypothetical protein VHC86_07870 [Opitutaceae bacterium]|nr:hypothetical protein [Opitutaceae bacterium]
MIRTARSADLPAIVRIYNEGVAAGFATGDLTPVSIEARREWFEEHHPDAHPI